MVEDANRQRALQIWADLGGFIRANSLDTHIFRTLEVVSSILGAEQGEAWRRDKERGWSRLGDDQLATTGETDLLERSLVSGPLTVESANDIDHITELAIPVAETGLVLHFASKTSLRFEACDLPFASSLSAEIAEVAAEFDAQFRSQKEHHDREARLRKQAHGLRQLLRRRQAPIGQHKAFQQLLSSATRIGRSSLPVLITGETGTGKEELAGFIHRASKRPKPIVVVDCGAIPASLLESELFGVERGAFTGATTQRVGRFEEADGGTLLLDEIGELPRELQPKLLRVLQDSRIRRVGGSKEIELDLRIVAATHRDLREMVDLGTFREDLFFRLKVVELAIPPLRARGDDVILLANHFIRQYSAELGREFIGLSADAQAKLSEHDWPGNVRELKNALRSAILTSQGAELTPADISLEGRAKRRSKSTQRPSDRPVGRTIKKSRGKAATALPGEVADWFWSVWAKTAPDEQGSPWDAIEAQLIRSALVRSSGSLSQAGALLGFSSETFGRHLDRLGGNSGGRTIRDHALAASLQANLGRPRIVDQCRSLVLTELLVHCRGNKSEMARILGCGRGTLVRDLVRLSIVEGQADEDTESSD